MDINGNTSMVQMARTVMGRKMGDAEGIVDERITLPPPRTSRGGAGISRRPIGTRGG